MPASSFVDFLIRRKSNCRQQFFYFADFCKFRTFSLQLWCHSCNNSAPNVFCILLSLMKALVPCLAHMLLRRFGHETTMKVLYCTLSMLGAELLQLWCQVTVASVNQEINKTGTLPHGISEVAISANLGLWVCWSGKTGHQQNWDFTTRHLSRCCSCGPAYC